jgi:aminopeptidase S
MAGGCLARDKIRQAQDHGALAMITMVSTWDDPNETLRPTLLDPTLIEIPAVVTGADPIDELLAAADARDEITLRVDVIEAPATDDNVFGELTGETDEVLMLGGHLDSVLDGPGVNDNGSGVATLLALAEAVAARPPALTVRFAFWAAEEYGTLGSIAYVDSLSAGDREALQAYLNLDMVASPNAGFYVYDDDSDPVSSDISDSIVAALSDFGISAGGIPSGGSDHIAFWRAGIPFGGVFSGIAPLTPAEADRYGGVAGAAADPCYHLSCDDRSNADVGTAALFGNAIAAVVEDLAY